MCTDLHVQGDDVVESVSCQLVTLAVSNQHFATDDGDGEEDDDVDDGDDDGDDDDGDDDDGDGEDVGDLYVKNSSMNVYVGETALTN